MKPQSAALPDDLATLRQELDRANVRLAEAHKMASLGRLSAGIVHEINTPIGSILSNNEVILRALENVRKLLGQAAKDGQPPPERALSLLETMSSLAAVDKIACERILSVVRSLKTFARVHEGDLRQVSLNELLENTIKLVKVVFRKRIEFVTAFAEMPDVECYPGLLNQVFLNLMVNAGQAIEGEGRIDIRTCLEGPRAHVEIQDSGQGIPKEVQDRIFSAGFTTKPIGEGTGLGLAISRDIIVDAHGGTIDFESQPGVGTTFHIRIPLRQARRETRGPDGNH